MILKNDIFFSMLRTEGFSRLLFILFLILIFKLTFRKLYPRIRGWLGERHVTSRIKTLGATCLHFHDVLLPAGDDKLHQIDHLLFTPGGIFVIETKNFLGWIYGDASSKNWTQVFGKRKKFKLLSPLFQNEAHVRTVKRYLPTRAQSNVHNLVVFTSGVFKTNMPDNVIKSEKLRSYIDRFAEPVFTDAQIKEMAEGVMANALTDKDSRARHLEGAKRAKRAA